MEYLDDLKAQLAEDSFTFTPVLDGTWQKIKSPIKGRYAAHIFENGVVLTVLSWDETYKKVYKSFTNGHVNGESGKIDEFVKLQVEETKRIKEAANEKACKEAKEFWDTKTLDKREDLPVPPYLERKKLGGLFGARIDSETGSIVCVPCRDIFNKLWGVQRIYANGEKSFWKGQRKEGTFHQIGEIRDFTYIVEGYATGVSVHEATGCPVIIAFDAGNLRRVAKEIRQRHHSATIVIAGDNDESGTGQKASENAAKEVGGYFKWPKVSGKDWNDCWVESPDDTKASFKLFEESLHKQKKFTDTFTIYNALERRGKVEMDPDWLVDQLFARESISILSADPKAGKSTLTRFLTSRLADGKDFLGFKCKPSKVLMIAVEEKERFLLRDFEKLDITNWQNIFYHTATTPSDAVKKAADEIIKCNPDFVIFDTMFKILQPEDENSYAQTTKVISQVQNLAAWHKIHILSVHHNNKGSASGFNKILGSNGIRGAFDYNIVIDCDAKEIEADSATATRFIMSEGREGHFFKKTALTFDWEKKYFGIGESFLTHQENKSRETTLNNLAKVKAPRNKTGWLAAMSGIGQKADRMLFFETLFDEKYIIDDPSGKKNSYVWNRNRTVKEDKF